LRTLGAGEGGYAQTVVRARDLLTRELLVLVRSTARIEEGVLSQDTDVALLSVTDEDGSPVLPTFTTEKTLNGWARPGAPFIGLPAEAVLDLLVSDTTPWDRMIVDSGGPGEFEVTVAEARQLVNP
jgi:hypothetical protein